MLSIVTISQPYRADSAGMSVVMIKVSGSHRTGVPADCHSFEAMVPNGSGGYGSISCAK